FEKTILPMAAQEHFKVGLCNELAQFHHNLQDLIRQTSDILQRTKDSPAFLRIDDKPVVYLYQVPFNPKLTPEAFSELRRGVEAKVGPVYWIMDKVANPLEQGLIFPKVWLEVGDIPMLGFYGTFSVKRVWKYADLIPDYRRLARQAHAPKKKIFLPVHPGH